MQALAVKVYPSLAAFVFKYEVLRGYLPMFSKHVHNFIFSVENIRKLRLLAFVYLNLTTLVWFVMSPG